MARAVSRGRDFWKSALDRQQLSGLSVAAFCRRESLSDKTFYLWRRRLGSAGEIRAGPSFTELVVDQSSGTGAKVEVMFDNGTRLLVTEIASDDQLMRILAAFRSEVGCSR